jgi:diguanylate cyclase (GGDEF)-like protein
MYRHPTRAASRSLAAIAAGLALAVVVAAADVATGYEINLGLFYLAPLAIVTWWVGRLAGIALGVASVVGMFVVDNHVTRDIPFPTTYLVPYWNSAIRLGYFVVFACILSALRKAYDRERAVARIDFLTGVPNRQGFSELLQDAIVRARLSTEPLAIAFLDCDNFKEINDRFGHESGDEVLRECASAIRRRLRAGDVAARIGGDEFAVILADAAGADARHLMAGISEELEAMSRSRGWPVTFSIGVVTFIDPPVDSRAALMESDRVMYEVKRGGKNGIAHCEVGGPRRQARVAAQ